MLALAGRHYCSRGVSLVVEEVVEVEAFSSVLAGVGWVPVFGEVSMRKEEVGGFPLPILEILVEESCFVAGDE